LICVDLDAVCLESIAQPIERFARGEVEEKFVHWAGNFCVGYDAIGKRTLPVRAICLSSVNRSIARPKQRNSPLGDGDFTSFSYRDIGD
jgi:hypothetical protein